MLAIGQMADTAVSLVELQKYPIGQLFCSEGDGQKFPMEHALAMLEPTRQYSPGMHGF